ncbi:unnamed protein product [Rotaria magnacalcarata]
MTHSGYQIAGKLALDMIQLRVPVCYTGQGQMEGFRQPILKFDMIKRAKGSCTNKLIPTNVNLDCLSSIQITANTESITTLDQLMENTKRNIDFSLSIDGFGNSFSYSHSHETRSMVNTTIQSNSTVYFTRANITLIRLSAFTPLLELSDQFRYAEIGTNVPGTVVNSWTMEEILGYVCGTKQSGACPLYRYCYWKPSQHFYTVDPCEIGVVKSGLIGAHGFKSEGIAIYVLTTFKCETIACQ